MHPTQVFGRFAAGFRDQALPPEVLHHAKRAVIDWHASLYPGLDTPAVRRLEQVLAEDLDHGHARLARGRRATSRAAALIHGTAAHAAEVDDSFREAMYHPGAATIAAALASAQAREAGGPAFLRGVVLGYEVSTRIGVAMGRPHYEYWHNTGTIGTFGAAAAVAEIGRQGEAAFAQSLAIAATLAAGLQQSFRRQAMAKPLHAGRAAEAGLLAAALAQEGLEASLDVLDGEAGFGRAMSRDVDWSRVGDTLGRDFHITRLTFKNHVGCGHAFPAIDGALELQRLHGFKAGDIHRLYVETYRTACDMAGHARPATADEARFSLAYMVATALVHGSVRLAAFEPGRLGDRATRALMERVEVSVDPAIDAAFPARRAARIRAVLRDGTRIEHLQPTRKGDPDAPLTDDELEGKLLELASPVIGEHEARALCERLWALETLERMP